jgi:tetratricopeptide (TPR) repeat protein
MPNKSTPSLRATAIASALEAAQRVDRDAFLRKLEGTSLRTGESAPLDERWLAGELAFIRGQYPEAIRRFEAFERDARSHAASPWQRYRSSHRRAFSYLHQGDDERARAALAEAEQRLELLPDRRLRQSDLHAMHGHLLNHQGDYERARARFTLGYDRAVAEENWGRAASTAADIAAMHMELNQLPEARHWLDRAEEALGRSPSSLVAATIAVRRGHVFRMTGMYGEAEPFYEQVIARGDALHPDPLEAAHRGRAEIRMARRDFARAEADLRRAAEICLSHNVRHHAAYAYRDLANLYVQRAEPGDQQRAIDEFQRALRLVITLHPPHPRMLMEFADEVLRQPQLLAGKLPADLRATLAERVSRLRELMRPHSFQQAVRAAEASVAYEALRVMFRQVELSQLRLKTRTVSLLSGSVTTPSDRHHLSPKLLEALQYIYDHPRGLTIEQLSEGLGIKLAAGSRRMMRLKDVLKEDLLATRDGNARRYALNMRAPEDP